MRVMVTGHNGYIGTVLVRLLQQAGHEVVGFDSYMFADCTLGPDWPDIPAVRKDLRDVEPDDIAGVEAICHLAGISNDPVGDLDADTTYAINHHAAARLAEIAAAVGVGRFVFSSSCSIYGASPGAFVTEESEINPVTPYGFSKIYAEGDIRALASPSFSPTCLRSATAYGYSPRVRADLVVNNLVGFAVTEGRVLMKSDGSPWRPLVHIEDISRAFVAAVEAPRERIHDQVLNVGSSEENYQIRDVADIVQEVVPGSEIVLSDTAGPDIRDYRVDCSKIEEVLPAFATQWTVRRGAEQLHEAFVNYGIGTDAFLGKLLRVKHVRSLQEAGVLGDDLRLMSSTGGARA